MMYEKMQLKHFTHPGRDGMFIEIVRYTIGSTPAESHGLLLI